MSRVVFHLILKFIYVPGSSYKGPFAHVRFITTEAAVEAMKAHQNTPMSIDGQELQVSYSEVAKAAKFDQPSSVLHFRGRLDQDELNSLLQPYQSNIKNIQCASRYLLSYLLKLISNEPLQT